MTPAQAHAQPDNAPVQQAPKNAAIALVQSAIGTVNLQYYLPILTRFEASNRISLTWNWSAGLYTLNWMAFRGLWRAARIYLGALICCAAMFAIIRLILPLPDITQASILILMALISVVVPGCFGNAWFHADIQEKVVQAVQASSTMIEANLKLANQASTRLGFIRLLQINALFMLAAGACYWFISSPAKPALDESAKTQAIDMRHKPLVSGTSIDSPVGSAATALLSRVPEVVLPQTPASQTPGIEPDTQFSSISSPPALTDCRDCQSVPSEPKDGRDMSKERASTEGKERSQNDYQNQKADNPVLAQKKPAPVGKAPVSVSPTKPSYYVNVGLFAKKANAEGTLGILQEAGFSATQQVLSTAQGKRVRVRAGPFENRSQAEEAAIKIRLLNLDGVVFLQK